MVRWACLWTHLVVRVRRASGARGKGLGTDGSAPTAARIVSRAAICAATSWWGGEPLVAELAATRLWCPGEAGAISNFLLILE